MFKPLLRTLPTLSGNFTVACKLREFNKENNKSNDEYSTYVRLANIVPLQNFMTNKDVELNLLNGKYEHDVAKYHHYYSDVFYKTNFEYSKDNYSILEANSIYNYNNDARNKDYEFGCKRIQYSQTGSQFNFYAPIYIDNVNDLPEYFCINIVINDHLTKKIKVYINKDNKRNYLKTYLTTYLKQIDERVIFCLPDTSQATYFGINVENGGIVQYKDNVFGILYKSQTTINNFDYTICKGFERNNLIMKQIIPLSFSFNINDIFNSYEKKYFRGKKFKIFGNYYDKYNKIIDMYDFDINYTHMYHKFKKYNEYTGKYTYVIGSKNNEDIDIMNVGYPSLNESKYIKYAYTNKITPYYCKFKLLHSNDEYPYIINASYAYTYNQYPSEKYGCFPIMFKGSYPKAIIKDGDFKLPIKESLSKYYNISSYNPNDITNDNINGNKYIKLMNNYHSSWINIINEENIDNIFTNDSLWADVKYDYSYFNGVLYNLSKLQKYNINKFGVFGNINIVMHDSKDINNTLLNSCLIFNSIENNTVQTFEYNNDYYMNINDSYYYKIVDNDKINSINFNDNLSINVNMIQDNNGTYIKEKHYIEEVTYYKVDNILKKLNNIINISYIYNQIEYAQIEGYELIDVAHNINFCDKNNNLIFDDKWKNILYYSTQSNSNKYSLNSLQNINSNENLSERVNIYLKSIFISKYDILHIIDNFNVFYDNTYSIDLTDITSYKYEFYTRNNDIELYSYFIKINDKETNNLSIELPLYVDSYNIENIINNTNIVTNIVYEDKFVKFLDKQHIKEYIEKIYNNNKHINNSSNFDIYVKKRYFVLDDNNYSISLKDKYTKLDNIIKIIDDLSDKRNSNNNFILNINETQEELDLCYKTKLIKVNNDIYNVLKDTYLYTYIPSKQVEDKLSTFEIISTANNQNNILYDYDGQDYVIPLYTNIYVNDTDVKNLNSMISTNKILSNGKYIDKYLNYFKEINVNETVNKILYKNINKNDIYNIKNLLETLIKKVSLDNLLTYNNDITISTNNIDNVEKIKKLLNVLINHISSNKVENININDFLNYLFNDENIKNSLIPLVNTVSLDKLLIYETTNFVNNINIKKLLKVLIKHISLNKVENINIDEFLNYIFNNEDKKSSLKDLLKILINSMRLNKFLIYHHGDFRLNSNIKKILVNGGYELFSTELIKYLYETLDNINNISSDKINNLIINAIVDYIYNGEYIEIPNNFVGDIENYKIIGKYKFIKYVITDIYGYDAFIDSFIRYIISIINNDKDTNIVNYIINEYLYVNETENIKYKKYIILKYIISDIYGYDTFISIFIDYLLETNICNEENIITYIIDFINKYDINILKYIVTNIYEFSEYDEFVKGLIYYLIDLSVNKTNDSNINQNEKIDKNDVIDNIKKLIEYSDNNIKNINDDNINDYIITYNDGDIFDKINVYSNEELIEYINNYDSVHNTEIGKYIAINIYGLKLYSISNSFLIDFNSDIVNSNLIYDNELNLYIYNDNNINYAFYLLDINIDNTNNSFNIEDDFNLLVSFNTIENQNLKNIQNNNEIFYLIEPFLKCNTFNEFAKKIDTIYYPYETEINIEYINSLFIDDNEKNKYKMLIEDENDKLYDQIVKIDKYKKIILIRYFNYITPYIKKTNMLNDQWELKFIHNSNNYKNIKKYNIFKKSNISINKYNGIECYNGIYSNSLYEYINKPIIEFQNEYKHFNDNLVFNLPEEIIVEDKNNYNEKQLEDIKGNTKEIENKKIKILLNYFQENNLEYDDIILFLFNKYDSNILLEPIKLRSNKKEKLYKIKYKFNLI